MVSKFYTYKNPIEIDKIIVGDIFEYKDGIYIRVSKIPARDGNDKVLVEGEVLLNLDVARDEEDKRNILMDYILDESDPEAWKDALKSYMEDEEPTY